MGDPTIIVEPKDNVETDYKLVDLVLTEWGSENVTVTELDE